MLVGVTVLYAGVVTFILFKIVDALLGMKVDRESEILGLDLSQQCESAYTVVD
jgi:Amt family ammonium transporter